MADYSRVVNRVFEDIKGDPEKLRAVTDLLGSYKGNMPAQLGVAVMNAAYRTGNSGTLPSSELHRIMGGLGIEILENGAAIAIITEVGEMALSMRDPAVVNEKAGRTCWIYENRLEGQENPSYLTSLVELKGDDSGLVGRFDGLSEDRVQAVFSLTAGYRGPRDGFTSILKYITDG
ncbi:MAG: hypothetical protein HY518_02835 [Candidatus Aenigmarchaeota archaeon]|nr:hypothetical protein [Candidatus Aenigmarchaeota archaeon]